MNIYEDEGLEQKLDELSDLLGQLVLDILLVSLRKAGQEHQIFREFAETRDPTTKKAEPF